MRPDEYVIGADPSQPGAEEAMIDVDGGCFKCKKSWPATTFKKLLGKHALGDEQVDPKEALCDNCWESELETAIAEKIDEAQGAITVPLIRSVEVMGIESKTNVVSFKYATHLGDKEIPLTLLNVAFKGKEQGEFTWYVYKDVPTATCEAWFAAPSHGESFGTFFAREIKHSYSWEKKA